MKFVLIFPFLGRFVGTASEPELTKDVVPCLNDNVQLSIEEYRDKLYEVGNNRCVHNAMCVVVMNV